MTTFLQKAFPKESVLPITGAARWLRNQLSSNSEHSIGSDVVVKKKSGPFVRFARFTNSGKLIDWVFAHTRDISYFAISHVWGDANWRSLACLDHEIYVSARKKRFIEEKLYEIVGDTPFWMDVLAVDQRKDDQVIAVVKNVPEIFMGAERTIAVKEGDGLYSCCASAISDSNGMHELKSSMLSHLQDQDHTRIALEELYLKRFWTLEEVLISHTVQFTTCVESISEYDEHFGRNEKARTHGHMLDNLYHDESLRIMDGLNSLAIGFGPEDEAVDEFMRAYIGCGTVIRKRTMTGAFGDPLSPMFYYFFAYSERRSSKPRDYVLALMAQYPWYKFPENAKHMAFNEIFYNLDQQAKQARKAFACRITKSMTQDCPREDAWDPSLDQPVPTCLGDFVLLLGNPLDQPPKANTPGPMHLVTLVAVTDPPYADEYPDEDDDEEHGDSSSDESSEDSSTSAEKKDELANLSIGLSAPFLETIQAAMEFSQLSWNMSDRAGELSKHGSWPEEPYSQRVAHWQRMLEQEDNTTESADFVRKVINDELEKEKRWASDEQFVMQEALKSLNLMFGASQWSGKGRTHKGDWRQYAQSRHGEWPIQLRRMMLLMAAMIGCKVPLSAAAWAKERFRPGIIRLGRETKCLGLLSKRHSSLITQRSEPRVDVFLASRGYSDDNRGKDIAILDPVSKTPVGLVPDFSDIGIIRNPTEWRRRMTILYGRLYASDCECRKAHFVFLPLDNLDREESSAEVYEVLSRTEASKRFDEPLRRSVKRLCHAQDSDRS